MPIRVPDELPAVSFLRNENVFVMTSSRAKTQEITPQRYRIKVGNDATQSQVSVLDAQGKADTSATAGKILQLLANDLK